MPSLPSANIYVDGFNLYRRQLQQRPGTKWLDLEKLTNLLLPTHRVNRIHYFTALIKPVLGTDPRAPERQNAYLRAISVNPRISITFGQFRSDTRLMPVVPIVLGIEGRPVTARVRKLEEKGSDVNLASRMIFDASQNDADLFVLISNDSDYSSMLKMLTNDLGKRFGLFSPNDFPSHELLAAKPLFVKKVREHALLASQLPDVVIDDDGRSISRPPSWK